MKITESRLRRIIRKVLLEDDQRDSYIAHSGYNSPTAFRGAFERGEVSQMDYYSNAPDHPYFPGRHFTQEQEEDAREICNIDGDRYYERKEKRIKNWCKIYKLTRKDFDACCNNLK